MEQARHCSSGARHIFGNAARIGCSALLRAAALTASWRNGTNVQWYKDCTMWLDGAYTAQTSYLGPSILRSPREHTFHLGDFTTKGGERFDYQRRVPLRFKIVCTEKVIGESDDDSPRKVIEPGGVRSEDLTREDPCYKPGPTGIIDCTKTYRFWSWTYQGRWSWEGTFFK